MKYVAVCLALVVMSSEAAWGDRSADAPGLGRRPGAGGGGGASVRPSARNGGGPAVSQRGTRGRRRGALRRRAASQAGNQNGRATASGQQRQRPPQAANLPAPAHPNLNRVDPHERAFQHRLAQIDRLRDQAIETGDETLLGRADEMERKAREHRARFMANKQRIAALPHGPNRDPAVEDDQRVPYGQTVSEHARRLGREFGQFTAEQAREQGREFGKSNANKTRIFERPVEPTPTPTEPSAGEPTLTDPPADAAPEPLPAVPEATPAG